MNECVMEFMTKARGEGYLLMKVPSHRRKEAT
jgi:hypothetical protein